MSTEIHHSQKQKFWSITHNLAFFAAFILILVVSGCQTAAPNDEQVAESPGDLEFKTALGIALTYLDAGRADKAMHELRPLLLKRPNDIEALNLMGITQLALSNPQRAVAHLEKAWKLKGTTPTGVNLSSAYYEVGRNKDAEKILTTLINRVEKPSYPHRERLYHNYGLVAEKTKRANLAEKMYKRAVEENPMFYLSHMQLARMYLERKKIVLATKELEAARFGCPVCFDPLAQLVQLKISQGKAKMAHQMIQDYKLTEGLTQADRRKASDLENKVIATVRLENQDASSKNR